MICNEGQHSSSVIKVSVVMHNIVIQSAPMLNVLCYMLFIIRCYAEYYWPKLLYAECRCAECRVFIDTVSAESL